MGCLLIVFFSFYFVDFDAFGDVLQPMSNNIMQPTNAGAAKAPSTNGTNGDQKFLSTDLESSLASLASNLDINPKYNNFQ